ncbi:MAG TPA: TIGR03663 family protein, partial [Vicinamibacteria bacterium]|nr:TIGR03663 family protein [Vicinamibacteria bacterium]
MKRLTRADVAALAVLAVAMFLRCQDLSLRPFHHDEGVNGFFETRLLREGAFKYDPSNYHGPTLYYLTLPLVAVVGLSDAAVRGTTVIFGLLTV